MRWPSSCFCCCCTYHLPARRYTHFHLSRILSGLAGAPQRTGAIVVFWRLPTPLARYRLLLIGSLVLPACMTWQWLTGFDQRPLDRIGAALAFTIANLLLVALTVWIARRAQRGIALHPLV